MPAILVQADDVLRRRVELTGGRPARIVSLVTLVTVFGFLYGAAMGSFGVLGQGGLQILYAGIKVPLLLLATFALSLPSYFVLNSLLGLRADFATSVRALLATQAGLAIILASLAPFTVVWYLSASDYSAAVLFNAAMFAVASLSAQAILRTYYRPLIARNHRHRWMLRAWFVVYAFIGIQMGWILRPFVGEPASPVQFFRSDTWDNAYVIVARMIWRMVQ